MVTREWPTQSRILSAVAGPSFSARPTRFSVVEPVETRRVVEVQVELGLRGAGEVPEGLGLADARAGRGRRRS